MSDHPGVLNVTEAAARLGISPEAVRKRALRGTLTGEKIGGSWYIQADALPTVEPAGRPDDAPDMASGREPDGSRTSGQERSEAPGRDLQPLADVIERLHAENVRLTEAATVWQLRAVQAEKHLARLAAGELAPDLGADSQTASPEPPGAPEPINEGQDAASAETVAPRGWRERVRRLFLG